MNLDAAELFEFVNFNTSLYQICYLFQKHLVIEGMLHCF